MAKSGNGPDRVRLWSAVVYPESAPEGWRDTLDDLHIEWVEGPLHDRDVDGNGEVKKPHWHILFLFEGPKSFEQVRAITDELHAPIPQRCHAIKGAVRYMAHLDNPEKYQYPVSEIRGHGGFDVAAALVPTSSQRVVLIGEMQDWCLSHHIIEIQDLFDYARLARPDDWYPLLCESCAMVMNLYIKSQRHRVQTT